MKSFRQEMLEVLVLALDALKIPPSPAERTALIEAPIEEKAAVLARLAPALRQEAARLRDTARGAHQEAVFDESLRLDLLDTASRRAAAALRSPRAAGERQALVVLRLLRAAPLVVTPPYVPVEIPWLRRTPGPDDVAPHARAHPLPGRPGGLWIACAEHRPADASSAGLFELFVEDAVVMSGMHTDPRTGRPVPLDTVNVTGCKWLQVTEYLLPAFLGAAAAPIDPTGAPILHVPTARALELVDVSERHQTERAVHQHPDLVARIQEGAADLRRVVRERDHHAQRVGELLHDADWFLARTRALTRFVPEVRCAVCTWVGWPYSCAVHPEGLLLCPICGAPCCDAAFPAPDWVIEALVVDVAGKAEAVRAAGGSPAPETWARVSQVAEALTMLSGVDDGEGHAARRCAVIAAVLVGDDARAVGLAERFAAEHRGREDTGAAEEIEALAAGNAILSYDAVLAAGRWSCCDEPLCVCGRGWLRWAERPDGRRWSGIFDRAAIGGVLRGVLTDEAAAAGGG